MGIILISPRLSFCCHSLHIQHVASMKFLAVLVSLAPLASSLPTYALPKTFVAAEGCELPEGYVLSKFTTWTPVGSNDTSISFNYFDESTNITTSCYKNSSSQAITSPGYAARYPCENSIVKFIWSNSKLGLIEEACPEDSSTSYEASGSVVPSLQCASKNCTVTGETGLQCTSANQTITAQFTSLQPAPPS